jgi:hypothetical protein
MAMPYIICIFANKEGKASNHRNLNRNPYASINMKTLCKANILRVSNRIGRYLLAGIFLLFFLPVGTVLQGVWVGSSR